MRRGSPEPGTSRPETVGAQRDREATLTELTTVVVCGLLGFWWLCSALAQLRPLRRRLLRWWDHSPLGPLLPSYTFFAPRPATYDLRLLMRHWSGEAPTDWREVVLAERWRWYHALWNPSKRQSKALSDLMRELSQLASAPRTVQLLSGYYLHLLTLVDGFAAPPETTHVQFAVVRTSAINQGQIPVPVVVSERHRLTAASPAGQPSESPAAPPSEPPAEHDRGGEPT